MKALVEMKDMLKYENEKLKQYKNAWEELKKTTCIKEPYDSYYDTGGNQSFEEVFNIFEELEQKYNLGE